MTREWKNGDTIDTADDMARYIASGDENESGEYSGLDITIEPVAFGASTCLIWRRASRADGRGTTDVSPTSLPCHRVGARSSTGMGRVRNDDTTLPGSLAVE